MILLAWLLLTLWATLFLVSARCDLRGLPGPSSDVEPYALWLPDGGTAPELEPPPQAVYEGSLPAQGPERLLVLRDCVVTDRQLPARLQGTGADFVSVFPRPGRGLFTQAYERFLRDFAGVGRVLNPQDAAGFADGRCAWLLRQHLDLAGVGAEPVLRAARALKAHGCAVDIRDGFTGEGPPWNDGVHAQPASAEKVRAIWPELAAPEPMARFLFIAFTFFLSVMPLVLLVDTTTRTLGILTIVLAMSTRVMTAVRDGYGIGLCLAGWGLEPYLAFCAGRTQMPATSNAMPLVSADTPPELTAAKEVTGLLARWANHAGVSFLARRLGGSSQVMEQVYSNTPCGDSMMGRFIDRQVHQSTAARAVRHRLVKTVELGRKYGGQRLLSVPCGSARDVAGILKGGEGMESVVLIDPDPWALEKAGEACADARLIQGGLDEVPDESFDLVIYVGLSEYLGDAEVIRHLKLLEKRLADHGRLITSVTDEHPQRGAMKDILGWSTRRRTPEAFISLIEMAGLVVESQTSDPHKAQWVMVLRPRETDRF